MKVTLTLEGDMMIEAAGKEGHHNLQYMGGSVFLSKESLVTCKPAIKLGQAKEVVFNGSLQRAQFGVGFRVEQVVSVK